MITPFDPEYYDYTAELDDKVDTLQFGKYNGKTPMYVFAENPGYICWATNNTNHWVGSETVVAAVFKATGHPREKAKPAKPVNQLKAAADAWSNMTQEQRNAEVAAFESRMYETFGEFPLTTKPWKAS